MKILTSILVMAVLSLSDNLPVTPSIDVSEPITAKCIESALSLPFGSLDGITVTSLPKPECGRLVCEGVAVEAFDYIPRKALDWLVFEEFYEGAAAAFAVLPDTKSNAEECMLTLNGEKSDESIVIRSDILAWKQVENGYFSGADMGY